jgi:flagellar basal body-associated protein FliL
MDIKNQDMIILYILLIIAIIASIIATFLGFSCSNKTSAKEQEVITIINSQMMRNTNQLQQTIFLK